MIIDKPIEERPIDRICKFADWCVDGKLCRSRSAFEHICKLTNNYLYNTKRFSGGNLGVDTITKIHKVFPMLNVVWVITGKGKMVEYVPDEGYHEAYLEVMKRINEIKNIIDSISVDTDLIPKINE